MKPDELKEKVAHFPEHPGVYFMKDPAGVVLYIGKAKSLKNRVVHYFRASSVDDDPRIRQMVSQIADVDFLETPTEIDALLAEARLIKDTQPKYNVHLKDDKSFPLLRITGDDDFPKLLVTRDRDDKTAEYYGPFTDAEGLREAVKILQKIFKFATCKLTILASDEKRRFFRPCILFNINRCTAPCADRVTKEEYADDIDSLRRFLKGGRKQLIRSLQKKMEEASAKLDFERAAEIRDQIRALDSLTKKAIGDDYIEGDLTPIDPKLGVQELTELLRTQGVDVGQVRSVDGVDIANIGGAEAVGAVVTFIDGIPFKSGYRHYKIKEVAGPDDYAMIREVVGRRFRRLAEDGAFPDVLLIDGGAGHLNAAGEVLRGMESVPSAILSLAKEDERVFLRVKGEPRLIEGMERYDHAHRLLMYIRDEAHRFAQHYHHFLRRKALFGGDV